MKKHLQKICRIALVGFGLSTINLSATSINVYDVDWTRFGLVNLTVDGAAKDEYAGIIKGTYDGGAPIDLMCVDLFTNISFGTYDSSTIYPRVARNEDRAAYLYANLYDPTVINTVALGEAMQIAIWDIVHDNGDGPNAGRIQANANTPGDVVAGWVNFLQLSDGKSSNNVSIFLNSVGIVQYQTLIGPVQAGTTVPPPVFTANVPEPGSFGMLAGGGLLLGMVWKRRRASHLRRQSAVMPSERLVR